MISFRVEWNPTGFVYGFQYCYSITCCGSGSADLDIDLRRMLDVSKTVKTLNWRRQMTVSSIVIYGVEYVIVSISSSNVKSDNLLPRILSSWIGPGGAGEGKVPTQAFQYILLTLHAFISFFDLPLL